MLLVTAAVAFVAGAANADPYQQNDSQYNFAQTAHSDEDKPDYGNNYNYGYDDGMAHRERDDHYRSHSYRHEARYDRGADYYGSDCNDTNATGTLMGAVAGGLIGGAASHGNGGAVLGGIAGDAMSSDMNCGDRRQAMMSYSQGFDGQIGHHYHWRNSEDNSYGRFTAVREYSRDGDTCRDYRETG